MLSDKKKSNKLLTFFILLLFRFLVWTAEALANQVSEENYAKGLTYPPFSNIRQISANIAANVAAKAYELGKCCLFSMH